MNAPEEVAKFYGGNKQKILQALQSGALRKFAPAPFDQTIALAAGNFIDEMRNAAQAEQIPQQTVFEKTFAPPAPMGGIGAPPPMPPQGPPAGLGATPEAAQMPQMPVPEMPMPEMPMPEMPQEEAPMGMAEGGLTTLPLPDTMFDEPNNGGYDDTFAGGGIVAFAGGGMSNLYDDVEYWESGGKQSAVSPKGARGVMQLMSGTSRDPGFGVEPTRDDSESENRRVGQQYLDAMFRRYGDQPTALAAYNWGPGNVDKWLQKGGDPKKLPAETKKYISNVMKGSEPPIRERNTRTAQGFTSNLNDISDLVDRRYGKTDEEKTNEEALLARAKEMGSPEYAAKEAKDSIYRTLAAIGFGAAASDAPDLASALFKSTAAEFGTYVADKKERKQLKDKALNLMVANGAKNRKDAMERFNLALKIQEGQLAQQQFGQKLDLDERQVVVAENKLREEIRLAGLTKPEDIKDRLQRIAFEYAPGTPEHEAAMRVLKVGSAPTAAANMTLEGIRNLKEGRAGGTAEGATAKDSDGKTIVFSNGQWMYP